MQFQAPHWLTLTIAAIGACSGALVTVFPQYAGLLGSIAALCALGAAPTLAKGDK